MIQNDWLTKKFLDFSLLVSTAPLVLLSVGSGYSPERLQYRDIR